MMHATPHDEVGLRLGAARVRPWLPEPRGPLTEQLFARLRRPLGSPTGVLNPDDFSALGDGDPTGEDVQLALYACLELRFQGFADVEPDWELDPGLVALQNRWGGAFLAAVAEEVGPVDARTPGEVRDELLAMASGDGPSLSSRMADSGTLRELQEFAVHRSAYQLKEADPHTYALPRLPAGRAKAAFVEVQADEYGGGRPGGAHQDLFATTMRALGLDDTYGAYVEHLPAVTLATVNLLSLFGRSRRWLGACVGHLALFEMTSVGPMGRYAAAVRRLTGSEAGARFYDVHVEADEYHQVLAVDGLVVPFVTESPEMAADVVFGARALGVVEGHLTAHLLDAWSAGTTSLRQPLP
jgi:hypothetical protein